MSGPVLGALIGAGTGGVIGASIALVRRFCRNTGQRVNRLADPRPTAEEQGRRTDPDPDLRYFRPASEVWSPHPTDRPPPE